MKTIGIFCAGQNGDILTISSVLKYRQELWGDCKIVWYIADENRDLLKYQDVELRTFPRGFGYPEMVEFENKILTDLGREPIWENWQPLVDWDNRMNVAIKHKYPSLEDIDIGYFPAPHQMTPQQRHGIEYPNISKKVFGVPQEWEWHPVTDFSEEETVALSEVVNELPYQKTIAIETFAGSGQSILSDRQIRIAMEMCNDVFGKCNFIWVSHKYLKDKDKFPSDLWPPAQINSNTFYAGKFTVRQCGYLVSLCDLLLSVSSGITVAASAWQLNPTPILQYCGSEICSTRAIALGRFELVTHDNKPLEVAQEEYYSRLRVLLNEIK